MYFIVTMFLGYVLVHEALARLETVEVSPETKYFLMAFIHEFGCRTPIKIKVKELSLLLGVSSSVVTKATASLVEKGFFFKEGHLPLRGRPKWNFGCTAKLIEMLDQGEVHDCGHTSKINRIFDNGKPQYREIELKNLTTSNKLLLVVMLANADEGGVIKGLGRSDLRKLTGMSDERLKAQIDKLLDQGLIRSALPGTTNDLFGVCTGVYFLNLAKFELATLSSGVVVYKEHQSSVALVESLYQQLLSYHKIKMPSTQAEIRSKTLADKFGISIESFQLIADSFVQGARAKFKRYMAFKINEYSSLILSKYWDTLSEENRVYDELVSIIRSDVKVSTSDDSCTSQDYRDAIISFLEQSSMRVAKVVYEFQKSVPNIDWGGMNQVILPDINYNGTIAVELHPKEGNEALLQWFLPTSELIQEKDMSSSKKYLYGLQASPTEMMTKR